ncbi:MAG TPA: DUF763 domain-containing protein [Candidatus Saccharimonadales bacterium]|nr:DUF763 domain-containing protein [Candidatus Saccharimonadales bacterium]
MVKSNMFTMTASYSKEFNLQYSMPSKIDWNLIKNIHEIHPSNYEEFLSVTGVGPSTVRAISLIAELIFGSKTAWKDPIKFTFAHGGKDGVPHFIDRKTYDESIKFLQSSIEGSEISRQDRDQSLKKLVEYNQKLFCHE